MLCQNCGKYEATTHLRRIINGETAEMHLCARCAAAMGYTRGFSPLGLGFGGLLDGLFGDMPLNKASGRSVRCEKCGCSFDDIVKNGKVGCPDCYKLFYDKISATVKKVHGSAVYVGDGKKASEARQSAQDMLLSLKKELQKAVEEQNFEYAVKLRDKIRAMEG